MIRKVNRISFKIQYSGRSSDYITPSFGQGCLYSCAYCYMRRYKPKGLDIAKNTEDILNVIVKHHNKLEKKKSNQTHSTKWTYDIGCNEDFALHWKYHDTNLILDTLIARDIFPTFATKYVNEEILKYNPGYNARIRFSLMPQELSTLLEPNTSSIIDRIKAINDFYYAGWDVHINFSPVIINKGTKELYKDLFNQINTIVDDDIKKNIKAEVIMLTHDERLHLRNLKENPKAEEILWQPNRQELKRTSFQSKKEKLTVLRYNRHKKAQYIKVFTELHKSIIPWNKIRYIF